MFKITRKEIKFGDDVLILETGKVARQASSVWVQMGGTVVLVCVVAQKHVKEGVDFFPLTVNYMEKYYASGRFPGGFFKREGRPLEREVLTSRLIDRPIRPLFPKGFHNEVQVTCTVMSYDTKHQPDILAMIGASAALEISGVPFDGPIGAVRVGYNQELGYVLNPSSEWISEHSNLDLVVAGTADAVLMVESEAKELSEEVMLGAVEFGHKAFGVVIEGIKHFSQSAGKQEWDFVMSHNTDIIEGVNALVGVRLVDAYNISSKVERYAAVDALKETVKSVLVEGQGLDENKVMAAFKEVQAFIVRKLTLDGTRIDGRRHSEVRPIEVEVDVLPCTHGSAIFTRGETQVIAIATLGTGDDEQIVDDIDGSRKDKFLLQYNFPPYSVGETGRVGAPGRREVGHGKLAFRALNPLLPKADQFPYTIRVVSEVTESNGSSSMATVCGASLCMMAAGVPLPSPVAGIAMGLILEGAEFCVLSDIMGDEDHLGDMDFKVAGTESGITALQMDIKIKGITHGIMEMALRQANQGRMHILGKMREALTESRGAVSDNAPQIKSIKIPKEKIGELIGPGGKVIKGIVEQTGVKIDINDDGIVNIASVSGEAMKKAMDMVTEIVAVPEVGKVYSGKVVKVLDFGAFVSIMRNCEGLVHVSEMSHRPVKNPRDILSEGDIVDVKMLGADPKTGKIRLSIKALLEPESGEDEMDVIESEVVIREERVAKEVNEGSSRKRFAKNGSKRENFRKQHVAKAEDKSEDNGDLVKKPRFF